MASARAALETPVARTRRASSGVSASGVSVSFFRNVSVARSFSSMGARS
jgi:hypothetical protein